VDKGHGRLEVRELTSTTLLAGYLEEWADACQVFRLTRTRVIDGKRTEETVYGITSLSRQEADAARLLALVRGHWGIENRLHHVRDATLKEDACRARKGAAAQVLAALRNAAVYLLEEVEAESKAAATRHLAGHPREALALFLDA
jgi:predicted transposase YbfD/YdcC